MSPKKPLLFFDLDHGRPAVQQFCCNDTYCGGSCISSNDSQSTLHSVRTSDLELQIGSTHMESNDMFQRSYHQIEPNYSHSPLSMCRNSEEMINLGTYNGGAHLIMRTPPEHRFRYRYDTEMSGTHGSLQGIKQGSKSGPEVELVNFPHEALIRVSLVTCNEVGERYPHPHSLFVKEKMYQKKMYENLRDKTVTKTGHYSDPHYIRVGMNGIDYTARFEGMCIISAKKENYSASIKEKLHLRGVEKGVKVADSDTSKIVEEAVKLVDLDFVSLCFEAFREEGGHLIRICPSLYSEPIGNAKSANTGKLKISRINKCSGSCKGGDEIWLLVEKINKKGLVIRFFEDDIDGKIIWESFIEGDDIILHHQYAIIFKTPPYRDSNISSEVKVFMRLERSSQLSQACNYSEPITFVYEPLKNKSSRSDNLYKKESILSPNKQVHIKRPRTDTAVVPAVNYQYKRKKDEQECSSPIFDEVGDIDNFLSDNGFDSTHIAQIWQWFNTEDWRQFFDESDVMLQKDGISSAVKGQELIPLLYVCSKYDENEVKKLTERINNLKFSMAKGKLKNGAGDEKKDVEDAVSTLLSLSERAVEISKSKKEVDRDESNSLQEAVLQNKPDLVRRILKSANYYIQDADLNTPLHLSLLLSHDYCTKYLLDFRRELRTSINWKNKEGKTPLHIAATLGNLHHVKLLIECGADVNETETNTKRNILHIAIVEKHRDLVRYLIENTNVSLDALDAEGKSPLVIAQMLMPPERGFLEEIFKKKDAKIGKWKEAIRINEAELDQLYDTLNETGSWQFLAEVWNCAYLISAAREMQNPSKFIFTCSEKRNGEIELEALRGLLDAVDDKKGLVVLDEILARRFL